MPRTHVGRRRTPPTPAGPSAALYHQVVVSRKAAWDDDWEVVDDIIPLNCTWAVAPSVSTATFRYDFGDRAAERVNTFAAAAPLDLFGQYVKIEAFGSEAASTPIATWVGMFTEDGRALDGRNIGDTDPSGRQILTALGLEHLLQKLPIDRMIFEIGGGELHEQPAGVPFNRRDVQTDGLIGNRSLAGGSASVFGTGGQFWTHQEIIHYLLTWVIGDRTSPWFRYHPQTDDELSEITVQDLAGLTVWEALNRLIDRRRGLTWRIRADGSDAVELVVSSLLESAITIGDVTVPANPVQVTKRIDPDIKIDEFMITRNDLTAYKYIDVRAAPFVCMFTLHHINGTLEADWTAAQLQAYRDAASDSPSYPTNPGLRALDNDRFRATNRSVNAVFRRFRAPRDWDFQVDLGLTENEINDIEVAPNARPDGFVTAFGYGGPPQFNPPKRLLTWLPMLVGVDYSTSPPTVDYDSDMQPELQKPLVMVKPSWYGEARQVVHDVSKLGHSGDGLPTTEARMLESGLGFELVTGGSTLPHHWGYGTFHPSSSSNAPTQRLPTKRDSLDYRNLSATVAVELDSRPYVRITANPNLDNDTVLTLDLPHLQYWFAPFGTVVGVTKDGEFKRIHTDNFVLRDDTPHLRRIATLVKSWYGKERSSIRWTQRSLEFVEPGSLLLTVAVGQHTQQVNTVVSRVTWDLLNQTTTIESQFGELDILRLIGTRRAT